MHHFIGAFLIGALAGGAAGRSAALRRALRKIVKGGITAKRKMEAMTAIGRAEIQKLVEEARADLDRAGTEQHS
jgi:hypothetical protein